MAKISHLFADGAACYDPNPLVWVTWEDCFHDDTPQHTVRGKTRPKEGWPYGTIHDMDCPGCQDVPYLASPRSETYWSS